MINFFKNNKTVLLISFITLAILIGGVFLFGKSGTTSPTSSEVNQALLVPEDAFITSGYLNGQYLPASSSATVTLVEFGDYECPACGIYNPWVNQLLTDFAGKFNYTFRNFPLPQHKNALISSYAVEAAGLQGKYWEMHEKVFSSSSEWVSLSKPQSVFEEYASSMGLDLIQFKKDIDSSQVKDKVQSDYNDSITLGINETPTFFLNGKKLNLTGRYDQLKTAVQTALYE